VIQKLLALTSALQFALSSFCLERRRCYAAAAGAVVVEGHKEWRKIVVEWKRKE